MQQLGLTKLNILCKIEHNSLLKESRYFKISRNKLIFSGFSCHFGFYPLKFCSKRKLRDNPAKFSLFRVFDSNQVSKRGPQKMVTDPKKFSSANISKSFQFKTYHRNDLLYIFLDKKERWEVLFLRRFLWILQIESENSK